MTQRGEIEKLDSERLLSEWRWLCPQGLTVIDRSAFGDLVLSDEMGRVYMLDVGGGEFSLVAESIPEFSELARTPEMRKRLVFPAKM